MLHMQNYSKKERQHVKSGEKSNIIFYYYVYNKIEKNKNYNKLSNHTDQALRN